ncbi:M48 family metallopeptidase [Cesiribacter andamanensis]|uniref:Putative metalloprotease yggG n=1 Tax=Cesiribacter andamanensis AMV16 TaxID=1279009 RepID=M7N1H3_9BACT|nr:M48 family metallopeptidase [Cesiribacter andamanensis]EMR02533.1 putative metalloprotease yggG [Cesiribacter andamanensis AMV16]
MKTLLPSLFLIPLLLLGSCSGENAINVFSPEDDAALGAQVNQEIQSQSDKFPILDPQQYPKSYEYLNGIVGHILESGQVRYRDEFNWTVYIIQDDNTLNAFATPGGYIYVYTGLIKYLDKEDDLAGVLGHEIAHADLRHSTRQLQKMYGLNLLLNLAFGDGGTAEQIMGQIVGNLTALSFSREYEREADMRSVEYLAATNYECDATKSFFIKLREAEDQSGQVPTFLSTHPNPENRIAAIEAQSQKMGCSTEPLNPASYQAFKQSLPGPTSSRASGGQTTTGGRASGTDW